MKIVADDKIPFLKGVFEPYIDIEYIPGHLIENKHLIDADALIIRTRTKCNADLLEGTNLKIIATATIGFDHIDTEYCNENQIYWTNAPGCNSGSVYQYIASALVTLSEKFDFDLKERTLGIIGVGNVGSKVENLADVFGMRVVRNDPPRMRETGMCGFISLDGVIREADIFTFHTPLNMGGIDNSFHLVDEKFLSKIQKNSLLINSSRGEVVDNNLILKALRTNGIAGAVLDVWENEPQINLSLLNELALSTPHIAGYSLDGKANGTKMAVQAVSKKLNLEILNNWEPDHLPLPEVPEFIIDAQNKSEFEVLSKAILHTYKISDDDIRLKKSPETFENQRGSYPMRREFHAYTITLKNGSDKQMYILKKLGFNVINHN